MDPHPPHLTDPALVVLCNGVAETLHAALPELVGNTPEALAARDAVAMRLVAALAPADAAEAALAAQSVVAGAHAFHCQWLAQQYSPASELGMKLRAQSAGFEHEAERSRSLLLTIQKKRRKREAANVAARPKSPPHGRGQDAGGGLATQGGAAVAQPALPPAPQEATKPAPARRSPPALRLIQGGLAS